MPRFLGVDHGTARVGLAVSDPGGVVAQPLEVLTDPGEDGFVTAVVRRARDLAVDEIVVGIPVRLDGRHGPEAEAAEGFARRLEAETGLPVRRWDERLSTAEATRAMQAGGEGTRRQRGSIDKVAAAVVLAAYLESRRAS
jgi:putative Holliday junction resolvase